MDAASGVLVILNSCPSCTVDVIADGNQLMNSFGNSMLHPRLAIRFYFLWLLLLEAKLSVNS